MVTFQTGSTTDLSTLPTIRRNALEHLQPEVADFLEGGAGDEGTMAANRAAFAQWGFSQRVMSGLRAPDLSTTFLGMNLSMPVLTAPFGADKLFHPDGQMAVARANQLMGTASIVPEAGSHSIEEIAGAAPGAARIAQIHPMGSPSNFISMLRRVEAAGYQALCLTVDCPTAGWRERIIDNAWDLDDVFVSGNYRDVGEAELGDVFGQLFERDGRVWSWPQLAEMMTHTHLPWIAKGIMTTADALAAEQAGAAAIYVSNHGGRQLDGVPASLRALVEVRGAIAGRIPIVFDSGIRRGADVVKALALGADVVVIGRLIVYGITIAGQRGAERVLTLLQDEIRTILTLLGRGDAAGIGPDALVNLSEQ